jgi:hypothetical protein
VELGEQSLYGDWAADCTASRDTRMSEDCFLIGHGELGPPLWSSGQSFWLHNGDVLCFL